MRRNPAIAVTPCSDLLQFCVPPVMKELHVTGLGVNHSQDDFWHVVNPKTPPHIAPPV